MHALTTLIVLAQVLAAEGTAVPPSTPAPVATPNTVTPKDNPPATITPSPPVSSQTPTVEPREGHSTSGEHVGKPN
jgi:hypothetical protein